MCLAKVFAAFLAHVAGFNIPRDTAGDAVQVIARVAMFQQTFQPNHISRTAQKPPKQALNILALVKGVEFYNVALKGFICNISYVPFCYGLLQSIHSFPFLLQKTHTKKKLSRNRNCSV